MLSLGELRSPDGLWTAIIYLRTTGTYGFRLWQCDAQTQTWVEAAGQTESVFASEKAAISDATTRHPQFAGQTYRPSPQEEPPESPEALRARGRHAMLSALGLAIGIALLYFRYLWPGLVFLSLGCLGLGWSIGGYGSAGYGGSNS